MILSLLRLIGRRRVALSDGGVVDRDEAVLESEHVDVSRSAPPSADGVDAFAAQMLAEGDAVARLELCRRLATAVVRAHGASVRSMCIARFGGDETLGEEAAQRAFVTFWRRLPTYRGEGKVHGFLLGITRRVCLEVARTRAVALKDVPELLPGEEQEVWSSLEDSVELRLLQEERREAIASAFGRLDEKNKWLLRQRYAEERSYQELLAEYQARFGAAITTEEGLRSAVFRAVNRLKTKLRGKDVDS